jgi:hypothetical protein
MRRATVHRTLGLLVAAATVFTLTGGAPADAAKAKTYSAPFKAGPAGGDSFSYHSADSSGTVTVGRVYPVPGVINCTKGGPYAKLTVPVRGPATKVVVSYDNAAIDNFTFAMVGLHDSKGNWFGTKQLRGFITGSGDITLLPDGGQGRGPLTVEFGLQQSSACPNADAGTIHFSEVQVFS